MTEHIDDVTVEVNVTIPQTNKIRSPYAHDSLDLTWAQGAIDLLESAYNDKKMELEREVKRLETVLKERADAPKEFEALKTGVYTVYGINRYVTSKRTREYADSNLRHFLTSFKNMILNTLNEDYGPNGEQNVRTHAIRITDRWLNNIKFIDKDEIIDSIMTGINVDEHATNSDLVALLKIVQGLISDDSDLVSMKSVDSPFNNKENGVVVIRDDFLTFIRIGGQLDDNKLVFSKSKWDNFHDMKLVFSDGKCSYSLFTEFDLINGDGRVIADHILFA
jgi:hypothetical protein